MSKVLKLILEQDSISLKTINRSISSRKTLNKAKEANLNYQSILSIFVTLMSNQLANLAIVILVATLAILLNIATPFFNQYLRDHYLGGKGGGIGEVLLLFVTVVGFKIVKNALTVVLDWHQMSLGYYYYAVVTYQILNKSQQLNGKLINILELDCQKLTNLAYASIICILNPIEIIVLLSLLIKYLLQSSDFSVFVWFTTTYFVLYSIGGYLTFVVNRKYMQQRDIRVNVGVEDAEELMVQREKQLAKNRTYLYLQIYTKFISYSYYTFLYLFIFMYVKRSEIKEHQFIILVLLGLIKSPIDRFIFAANLMIEIVYSIKRIRDVSQREVEDGCLREELVVVKNKILRQLKSTKKKEQGEINLKSIKKYYNSHVSCTLTLLLAVIFLMMLVLKYIGVSINKRTLNLSYNIFDVLGLLGQIVTPLVFLFILIHLSQKLSKEIFSELSNTKDIEVINRISGDISSVDKSLCLNGFQLISIFSFIATSILYSLLELDNLWMQIGFGLFFGGCSFICFKFYRFVMRSRREVARGECYKKSKILWGLYKEKNMSSSSEIGSAWKTIYKTKYLGLLIELFYTLLIFSILTVFTSYLITLSLSVSIAEVDRSIILLTCMQIDNQIISMFVSAIRFQKGMVSFERVINVLKK